MADRYIKNLHESEAHGDHNSCWEMSTTKSRKIIEDKKKPPRGGGLKNSEKDQVVAEKVTPMTAVEADIVMVLLFAASPRATTRSSAPP